MPFCIKSLAPLSLFLSLSLVPCALFSHQSFPHLARSSWFASQGINREDFQQFWLTDENRKEEAKVEEILWLIALREAYPKLGLKISWEGTDWLVQAKTGEELYWAGGRLLPTLERSRAQAYQGLFAYECVDKLYDSSQLDLQLKEAITARYSAGKLAHLRETPLFWAKLLYGAREEEGIKSRLEETQFLGYKVKVHPLLIKPLERAQAKIHSASTQEMSVRREIHQFQEKLEEKGLESFIWRPVKGTPSVSYHSFAVAIDFLIKGDQRDVYWQSARNEGEEWVSRPLKDRLQIPEIIVEALEAEGFLWGGKWINWDVQHFEYRPELYRFTELKREFEDYWNYIF